MAFREFRKNKSETVRVSATNYEGHDLINVRAYALNRSTGEVGPTKKGISLNIDTIPELIDALAWALGQPCSSDPNTAERQLKPIDEERLARVAWEALRKHGTAVHWDSAEKLILSDIKGFSKWDLHYVLATRKDLFERADQGCFRARRPTG